ncbi:hypothetical protein [Desulforamulus aquiferis]|uniref:DUF2796 domain-containing protein n=1 Tax=Desulforamulus aquiferis TaxID=1397668 RepID=A0AAW7Z9G1_9FIRM|nr:hypothetical protein [Desulforamulus aquiferis]MDO7785904.1 hypothetical protein [Desulforamulus aquiferis]RYD02129.1 hypothetical protein N752_27140 [Desulforamulus aquiferis]
MNKIKLMYDIAKTMKEKEVFNGFLQVECAKDSTAIFHMENEFSKNLTSGLMVAKIKTEMDYQGKTFKHESNTEYTQLSKSQSKGCFRGRHPHFHHRGHGGLKGLFTGLTLALDILNRTKVEPQTDNSNLITLEMNELPKELQELKQHFMESHGHGHAHENHQHGHCLMKEFHELQNPKLILTAQINKNNEIESVEILLSGKRQGSLDEGHSLNLKAKLTFINN